MFLCSSSLPILKDCVHRGLVYGQDKTRETSSGALLPSHYYPLRSSMMAYYGIFLTILDNIILGGDDHILINSDQNVFVELDSCF